MRAQILTLPGDGIGPETVSAAKAVLQKTAEKFGHAFVFSEEKIGGCAIDACGNPLPAATVEAAHKADAVLLGAVGGDKWDNAPLRPEAALLGIRKELGLYANIRPAKLFPSLKNASVLKEEIAERGIDLVTVRELTGGIYFGERGYRTGAFGREAYDTECYGELEIERVARIAFEIAEKRRKKLCLVDKANVLTSSKLWRKVMGECTEDELREVNAWLEESGENARELFRLEEIYHLGRLGDTSNTQDIEKAEKRLFKRLEQEKTKQYKVRRMVGWMRYAAVFVGFFLLGTFGYLFYQTYSQPETLLAVTTHDKIKELKLPDGTKVWLNKNTTLKYPHEFAGKGRKVYLEGEGYFEVMRNLEKPFVVQSEAMQVRVLGTVFNLKSDKAKMSAVATLLKGEVEVKGNHGEGMIILAPGQKAELNGMTRRLVVKQVDTGIENWHNNEFVFEKADLYTIARTLENSYGVRVILAPNIDVSKTYSGTLKKKESVGAVLNLIKNAIPLEYKIVGNSVFLSSTK